MISIEKIDHIGIRVTQRDRALAFYEVLGFKLLFEPDFDQVAIIKNDAGVEINLILNGEDSLEGKNILMDLPVKHPGITHVALRVTDIVKAMRHCKNTVLPSRKGP
jgi:lactoylglutathione lyase